AFTVSTLFEPGAVAASASVNGLGVGATVTINLPATVFGTGAFTTSVIVDPTNAIIESNESNNIYSFSYRIDMPLLADVQTFSLPTGVGIDAAGGTPDFIWTGFS